MAQLNFPTTHQGGGPLQPGDQYTGDNGVTYIYDGVKWVGHAANSNPGTNSITNQGYTVQVDPTGNLVIPTSATIVFQSGAPVVPTVVSAFTNDSGYLTSSTVGQYVTAGSVTVQERFYDYTNLNLYGTNGLTAVLAVNEDDAEHEIMLPFAINFLGQTYNSVWLDSNSYISFAAVSSGPAGYPVYFPQGPELLGVPAILIGAADRELINYYYLYCYCHL